MKGFLVDAGLDGTVRGYVDCPYLELHLNVNVIGQLDVGRAIGRKGFLYVVRDIWRSRR